MTVHPPAGGPGQLKQWALAALLGAVVALVGFVVLQALNPRNGEPATADIPPTQADAVEAAAPPATSPVAALGDEASGTEASGTEASGTGASGTEVSGTGAPAEREMAPAEREAAGVEPKARVDVPPAVDVAPTRDVPPERDSPPTAGLPSKTRADRSPLSGMRFVALRSFTSRSTERDFRQVQEAARRLSGKGSSPAQASAMQRYADGGLAYLQGNDVIAAENLREVLRNPRFVAFWGPSPLMLLASSEAERDFEPWELALGYGDARASAGAELDRLLSAKPDGARYRFARALVHRLDGEHAPAIRYAAPVFQQLQNEDAAEAASYLALIIADAYLGLDRGDEAFDWYRRAVRAGGAFRGAVAMRASEAARQVRRPDEAVEFLRPACEAGLRPACERLEKSSRE